MAFGLSFASVDRDSTFNGAGLTIDAFLADGKYMAMGEHLSKAVITRTKTKELWVKGFLAEMKVETRSLSVAAGGMASASSL